MKNPKSNYIGDARRIRRKRRILQGIVAGAVVVVLGFIIFFTYILKLKEDIDESFPDYTSYETSETDATSSSDPSSPSSEPSETTAPTTTTSAATTETQDPEMTTTEPGESSSDITSGEGSDPSETGDPSETTDGSETSETTVSLLPDEPTERDPVLFPSKYPLQKVTHDERDQAYAAMKQAVKKYIETHAGARIGFYYLNLSTSEAFGFNDTQPFVVGSCIHLPMVKLLYDDVRAGRMTMDRVVTYHTSDSKVRSAVSNYPDGKQFYLSQLADLAIKDGDGVAMNMLFDPMGGMDDVFNRLKSMTLCIDYTAVQNYVDYKKVQQAGAYRSSAYDLAHYTETIYWDYMSYPEHYQSLIDSLAHCNSNWGVAKQFPADTLVLHRAGSNVTFHSEADVAIILSAEPVIISVTVEADTPDEAREIQAALGALVYNFISYCHS